jgi:hypothetical protein
MIVIGSCFASVFTLIAITIERYRSVLLSTKVTDTQAHWMIVGIWVASIFIVSIPVFTQSTGKAYGLNPGLLVCTISWSEWSPAPLFMTSLVFVTLLATTCLIAFIYTKIVVSYFTLQRRTMQTQTQFGTEATQAVSSAGPIVSEKSDKVQEFTKQQKKLIIKSAVLTGSFFCCWTPYMVKILIEIGSGQSIAAEWDIFCTMGALGNSAVNSFLLLLLDSRIKKEDLFGSS